MELGNNHRQALLSELEDAQSERSVANRALNSKIAINDPAVFNAFEVREWIALERIGAIKKALVDNHIDY